MSSEQEGSGTDDVPDPLPFEATFSAAIYGGRREEVMESIQSHFSDSEQPDVHQTWINVSAMRRLGFLFEGGVESAGGLVEILCMFAVLAAVLGAFVFWQIIVFFIVLGVLTLFSGGAALKYIRGSFISADAEKMDYEALESLTIDQVKQGRFVMIDAGDRKSKLGEVSKKATTATRVFRWGIHFALLIATVFFVFEVVYYILNLSWYTDIFALIPFGLAFLVGIILMDVGVLLRYRLDRALDDGVPVK